MVNKLQEELILISVWRIKGLNKSYLIFLPKLIDSGRHKQTKNFKKQMFRKYLFLVFFRFCIFSKKIISKEWIYIGSKHFNFI